ncbi:MAG: DUF1818 family protein [Cyanobacteria bacterium J06638_7]
MQVQEGPGWRLCVDPARAPYPVLIGGDGWAVELRAEEASALWDGCCRLADELAAMADRLMPEEQLTLELESGPLWLELEGQPRKWRLRFMLSPGTAARGVEAGWSEAAAAAMVAALRQARSQSGLAPG